MKDKEIRSILIAYLKAIHNEVRIIDLFGNLSDDDCKEIFLSNKA